MNKIYLNIKNYFYNFFNVTKKNKKTEKNHELISSDKNLYIKLNGGLGNQLFLYSFGRSIAPDLKLQLYLDISSYNFKNTLKHSIYGLHPYNIKGIVGVYPFKEYESKNNEFLTLYKKGLPFTIDGNYCDTFFENIKGQINFPCYFTGYYNSSIKKDKKRYITEKFFIHNEEIIKNDLIYLLTHERHSELIKDIEKSNSVRFT
ncbi:MAG: hypothetical protein IJJ47_09215 [Methanosphaera sp.]|nr:hypothetical protein [Methanosphaera sp.]